MSSLQPLSFALRALLLLILGILMSCNSDTDTDREALLHFKSNIFHDPQGILNSWNDSLHFCQWQGVTCSPTQRRVTAIDLRFGGLRGYLSPYIGNLSLLHEIWLGNNTLQGRIPPEIGRLSNLQILGLNNNSLQGQIPTNLSNCSNLVYIALDVNMLVGNIPQELGFLLNLKKLLIHNNTLTGGIPSFIGNFTSLETFNAAGNALGGTIPEALGQLKNLTDLLLGSNRLHGTIPPSIYNLSSLRVLSLLENQIHGSLPPDLFFMLPHIQVLRLRLNQFSGPLPFSLSNASFLEIIDLMKNNFNGKISTNFGVLLHLKRLTFGSNNLGGGELDDLDFMLSLANCSNLEVLSLGNNNLKAALPNYVGNLSTQLSLLGLSLNHLYGDIPSSIINLVNLSILILRGNQLKGTIPSNIGHLQKLGMFLLDSNILSGKIPYSIGNLSLLSQLRLDNNRLQGAIPSVFENFQNLILLNLSHNNLNGTIPKQLFSISTLSISLNLARNRLLGSLPTEIGNLKNLEELDLSENKLADVIPSSLGSCIALERLYLEGNFFRGPIPLSLTFLRGILIIDLSHNNLSGQIPQYLEELSLNKLNLSFNNLEGSVPTRGVFANASAISIAGNSRLCGGIYELELPRCNAETSKTSIIIISTVAAIIGAILMCVIMVYCFKKKEITDEGHSRSFFERSCLTVSYGMLFRATNGFSKDNLIGVGGFGNIFKGKLGPDGAVVAIKVLNFSQDHQQRASKSFVTECETMRNIRHRNIVKVISCCSSVDFQGKDFKALVYEFMPNGSLDRWLHPGAENKDIGEHQTLTLVQRVSIAIDVACALNYLHHHCQRPIVHCDLKPSNVLLDYEMTAHVGDFGLARFLLEVANLNNDSSLGVRGTIGYVSPEYGVGSKISREGDVYSYGILLLEMMTGKRPTDGMFDRGFNLHEYVKMALPEQVMEILDPTLVKNVQETALAYVILVVMKIGVACTMPTPKVRMGISGVVHELNLVREILEETQSREERLL